MHKRKAEIEIFEEEGDRKKKHMKYGREEWYESNSQTMWWEIIALEKKNGPNTKKSTSYINIFIRVGRCSIAVLFFCVCYDTIFNRISHAFSILCLVCRELYWQMQFKWRFRCKPSSIKLFTLATFSPSCNYLPVFSAPSIEYFIHFSLMCFILRFYYAAFFCFCSWKFDAFR